jgi:hypothetical protein
MGGEGDNDRISGRLLERRNTKDDVDEKAGVKRR